MTSDAEFWVGPDSAPETYQLVSLLGGGGEGEVWRGILPLSSAGRREVAIKLMRGTGASDEVDSWQRYGHLLKSLAHPGLVRVTDVFLGRGPHRRGELPHPSTFRYVVMDYVPGPTLRDWVDESPQATASNRLGQLRTIASALDEMHSGSRTEIPVAHGDVKPANIVVNPQGGTVLVDLGLARLTDATGVAGRSNPYAAPEIRYAYAQATPPADVYAFAVTMAQTLTGQPPPTDQNGFLDVGAMGQLLQAAPMTQRRPYLVDQIMTVLVSPPQARPVALRPWLDAAVETLSQITSPPPGEAMTPLPSNDVTVASSGFPAGSTQPTRPAEPDAGPRRRRRRLIWLVAAVVAVLLAAGGVAFAMAANSKHTAAPSTSTTPSPSTADSVSQSPSGSPSPSDSPSVSDSSSASSSSSSSASSTPSASESTLPPDTRLPATTQWVGDLHAVDYDAAANSNDLAESDAADINGTTYAHSLLMSVHCSREDGGEYWDEYDLARSWSVLDGIVGMDDGAPSTAAMTWRVYGDGKLIASGSSRLGAPVHLHVSVKNVLRLRLWIDDPASLSNNCGSAGSSTGQIDWGNLELTA